MKKFLLSLLALAALAFSASPAMAAKVESWKLVDSFDVESNTVTPIERNKLDLGFNYKIVVTNTYNAGDNIEADALCSFRTGSSTEWTDLVSSYEYYGPELLDLHVNGESNWGTECRSDHKYTQIIQGDGEVPNFYIYDIYPFNNTGKLHVEIYKFWKSSGGKSDTCINIQSDTLTDTKGNIINLGFDQWGYNYQGKIFNGFYENYSRPSELATSGDWLMMKWNDAWLSNKDCDGDGKLDRHLGLPSYIGSGAWLTNHMSGEYSGDDDQSCKWNYFVKIVAKPTLEYSCNAIWGEFCIIQEVSNDPCLGDHGLLYKSPVRVGLGNW